MSWQYRRRHRKRRDPRMRVLDIPDSISPERGIPNPRSGTISPGDQAAVNLFPSRGARQKVS